MLNTCYPDIVVRKKRGDQIFEEYAAGMLKAKGAKVKAFEIHSLTTNEEMQKIHKQIQKADIIFINFHAIPSYGIGTLIPNVNILSLFYGGILSLKKPVIVTSFGDPFVNNYFTTAGTYICTYDETIFSQESAVKAWLGEIPFRGKSPVSLEYVFKKGDGIKTG